MEVTDEKKELLNPTSRDVQMGAILDQCVGKKAERKISRQRIDIVQGNVNSYARILNGAAQIDNIRTFTQLASSMSTFTVKREDQTVQSRMQKKRDEEEKTAKKLENYQKAKAENERILLICEENVAKGIVHFLSLNLTSKIGILKLVFARKDTKSSLRLQRANRILEELLLTPPEEDSDALEIEEAHNVAALEVPTLEGGGDGGGGDSMAAL